MGRAIDLQPRGKRPADAGFTLIELLVVVAILSVLSIGAGLAVGRPVSGADSDLALFRDRFRAEADLAVYARQMRGLVLDPAGLRLARWENGDWIISDHLVRWRGRVHWQAEGRSAARGAPDILFLANGQTSTFSISFSAAGSRARCTSDGWAGLQCDQR